MTTTAIASLLMWLAMGYKLKAPDAYYAIQHGLLAGVLISILSMALGKAMLFKGSHVALAIILILLFGVLFALHVARVSI